MEQPLLPPESPNVEAEDNRYHVSTGICQIVFRVINTREAQLVGANTTLKKAGN